MKQLQKIIDYLKENLIEKFEEENDRKTLNLAETLDILKCWQEYRLFYKERFFKVNPFDVLLNSNGNLYFKENKRILEIGKIKDVLFIYDSILEENVKIDFFKISLETGFLFKGQILTKKQKEILNNQFFKSSKEIQKPDFKNLSIEKYV